MRIIETTLPFSHELANGPLTLKVEQSDNGPDLWIDQSGDKLLLAVDDWPKIRKAIDDVICAYEQLEKAQFEKVK